jgi:hypothetical protein
MYAFYKRLKIPLAEFIPLSSVISTEPVNVCFVSRDFISGRHMIRFKEFSLCKTLKPALLTFKDDGL